MASRVTIFMKIGVLATTSLLLAIVFVATAAAAPVGDATQGKALYDKDCLSCHGADHSGGVKLGNATSADVRWNALLAMYSPKGDPIALAKRAILTGVDEDGEDLDSAMPRWQGKLSDADLNNIIAFLQTVPGPATSTMKMNSDQATPTSLPKAGSPLGTESMPWIAGLAAILIVAGFGIRRWMRDLGRDS